MRIVAVVPIKMNNRRLPNKNTRRFTEGEPLCTYVLNTLLQCKSIDEIYVYCSNPDICDFIPKGIKFLRRSEKLDEDTTKMNEILMSFAENIYADIYVMTHVTAPFISVESIERGIDSVKNLGYDSAFTVKKLQDFIWKNNIPFNYDLKSIPRTQDLDPLYIETSGFYIFNRSIINNEGRRIGDFPCLIEIGEIESIDIDEYEDFVIADAIQFYNLHNKETNYIKSID